jgi:hypothetical protein
MSENGSRADVAGANLFKAIVAAPGEVKPTSVACVSWNMPSQRQHGIDSQIPVTMRWYAERQASDLKWNDK